MLIDITDATYIEEFKIKIIFENGANGIIDFSEYCQKGGVFEQLKDESYFKQFYINPDLGTICWPNGLDIAPETLLEKIR
jgi:hypothetical protein